MTQQFDFTPRPDCICGEQLAEDAVLVEKQFPQGRIVFRRCRVCGSYIQSPCLAPSSLAAWYDSADYRGGGNTLGAGYLDYASGESQRRVEARIRYRRDLAPYLPVSARVLEIGAASGALLAELREHKHIPFGCDLSSAFSESARQHYGLDVKVCDWLDFDISDFDMDAVVLLGTISNLTKLGPSLERVSKKLKPGGFIFFNFPAADSWPVKLYREHMWMFTPSVMQFMTGCGMRLALERAGLTVEQQAMDRQSPTLSKLVGHARLGFIYPFIVRTGLADAALPFGVPLPGIVAVRARPNPEAVSNSVVDDQT
jgi:SAM-dependent methyltransferase